MTIPDDIGSRVRHRRLELGMTLEEVAQRAGMAPTFVGYLEGQPAAMGIDTLIRIADALSTSVNALLGGSAHAPPNRRPAGHPRVFERLGWMSAGDCSHQAVSDGWPS
jgi:transcriptional regulator with XRE-family HTH domain